MGLDIRLPMGAFFSLIGAMLAVYGAFADRAIYERSLGYNVNLSWGLAILVFGVWLLYLSRRGTAAARPAELDPEGRAIEEREMVEGLESENPVAGPPGAEE
jgi:hypothetical protein